jgi:hypothetical protein
MALELHCRLQVNIAEKSTSVLTAFLPPFSFFCDELREKDATFLKPVCLRAVLSRYMMLEQSAAFL